MVADELARRWNADPWTKRKDARFTLARAQRAAIVEPLAYMNASGPPTQGVAARYKIPPDRILAIVDDLDLPFGRLRLRFSGSSGGHNGLKSLIAVFGENFARLRVGIGRDREHGDAIGHVLGAFDEDEERALPGLVDRCVEGVELWLRGDRQAALNRVNAQNAPRPREAGP